MEIWFVVIRALFEWSFNNLTNYHLRSASKGDRRCVAVVGTTGEGIVIDGVGIEKVAHSKKETDIAES